MKTLLLVLLGSFALTLTAFAQTPVATQIDPKQKYEFAPSADCEVSQYIKREWQKAPEAKISPTEPFLLHEVAHQPEASSFYFNHQLYSAPSKCFVLAGAAKHIETKAEPKVEVSAKDAELDEKHEEKDEVEMESEFLHQANAHVLELTPSFGFASTHDNYQLAALRSYEISGVVAGGIVEYGFNSHFSLGASIAYDHVTATPNPSTSGDTSIRGFEDPKFFFNAKTEFGDSALRFNIVLAEPFASHRSENEQIHVNNVKNGSTLITPAIGFEYHSGRNIFGAQLAYDVVKSNITVDATDDTGALSNSVITGGRALTAALFYERRFEKGEFGLSLQFLSVDSTTDNGEETGDGGHIWIASFYGEIELTHKISLLPVFTYSKPNFQEGIARGNIDSISNFGIALAARFKL